MPSLLERVLKQTNIKKASVLSTSDFFNSSVVVPTMIPALNIALYGEVHGGLTNGLTMLAGESKSFKTTIALVLMKAYMDRYPDAVAIFYDTEFGSPQAYFEACGIDMTRVIHIPLNNLEELKLDCVRQLEALEEKDHVFIMIDSVGNIASRKELEDVLENKSVTDMSRAKQFKSFYRMVTPYLTMKHVPMVVINHIYMEQGAMYPKAIVSGGSGGIYSSSTILIITKSQIKEGTELVGWNFNINVEKSRFVREKSRVPLTVRYDGGISQFSGLFDLASDFGFIESPTQGWYTTVETDPKTGEVVRGTKMRRADLETSPEFWKRMLAKDSEFCRQVKQEFQVGISSLVQGESLVDTSTDPED